jgi:hypothetical protein
LDHGPSENVRGGWCAREIRKDLNDPNYLNDFAVLNGIFAPRGAVTPSLVGRGRTASSLSSEAGPLLVPDANLRGKRR